MMQLGVDPHKSHSHANLLLIWRCSIHFFFFWNSNINSNLKRYTAKPLDTRFNACLARRSASELPFHISILLLFENI